VYHDEDDGILRHLPTTVAKDGDLYAIHHTILAAANLYQRTSSNCTFRNFESDMLGPKWTSPKTTGIAIIIFVMLGNHEGRYPNCQIEVYIYPYLISCNVWETFTNQLHVGVQVHVHTNWPIIKKIPFAP
jgi:hypothetical protein